MTQQEPAYTTRRQYLDAIAATRDARMQWWREARFGMFVHLGLYSVLGRHEWAMATECIPAAEYERLADEFHPKPGCAREWARLAKASGMKYMVFTTKHHEGYCLWDTEQTDYNSVRSGPKRDLVAEYVEACRAEGLRVGLYYSLMDWHHPDGGTCLVDPDARRRFLDYARALVRELMSNYGKIDILWYDVPNPLTNAEGWESDALNQMVRSLQPDILINNRSRLDEDFATPEGKVVAENDGTGRGWEACMTFNHESWGYMHGVEIDAFRCRDILKMLATACQDGGNLLLNIGPLPDGSVPPDAIKPLQSTGRWLERHGEAVYGALDPAGAFLQFPVKVSRKGSTVYVWRIVWAGREQGLGGYQTPVERVTCVTTGEKVDFTQEGGRILLKNLPEVCPDKEASLAVFKLEFPQPPEYRWAPTTPALYALW